VPDCGFYPSMLYRFYRLFTHVDSLFGSLLEVINGNTCPKNGSGLALCYVSLSFAIVIAGLYLFLIKARAAKDA